MHGICLELMVSPARRGWGRGGGGGGCHSRKLLHLFWVATDAQAAHCLGSIVAIGICALSALQRML